MKKSNDIALKILRGLLPGKMELEKSYWSKLAKKKPVRIFDPIRGDLAFSMCKNLTADGFSEIIQSTIRKKNLENDGKQFAFPYIYNKEYYDEINCELYTEAFEPLTEDPHIYYDGQNKHYDFSNLVFSFSEFLCHILKYDTVLKQEVLFLNEFSNSLFENDFLLKSITNSIVCLEKLASELAISNDSESLNNKSEINKILQNELSHLNNSVSKLQDKILKGHDSDLRRMFPVVTEIFHTLYEKPTNTIIRPKFDEVVKEKLPDASLRSIGLYWNLIHPSHKTPHRPKKEEEP